MTVLIFDFILALFVMLQQFLVFLFLSLESLTGIATLVVMVVSDICEKTRQEERAHL